MTAAASVAFGTEPASQSPGVVQSALAPADQVKLGIIQFLKLIAHIERRASCLSNSLINNNKINEASNRLFDVPISKLSMPCAYGCLSPRAATRCRAGPSGVGENVLCG